MCGGGDTKIVFFVSGDESLDNCKLEENNGGRGSIDTSFFPPTMNFNILFLNGSLSCCSSSWSTEKNNQFFYQTVRIYLSYFSRNNFKKRRRWETNAGIFYCLPVRVYSHLGQITPLHLRIEREATTFQTASYINNTALSVTFSRGPNVLNPSGLAQTKNI